jgi:hypothetical protein
MRHLTLTVAVIVSLGAGRADPPPKPEEMTERLTKIVPRLAELLKSVKDEASAAAVKPEFDRLAAEMMKLVGEGQRLPEEQQNAVKDLMAERLKQPMEEMQREVKRLEAMPAVYQALMKGNPLQKKSDTAKKDVARVTARNLTTAAQTYRIKYGDYPTALSDLADGRNGDKPFIERGTLTDPWGRPYQYDPAGPKNGGIRPDVWSLGPPDEKDGVIGNWQREK